MHRPLSVCLHEVKTVLVDYFLFVAKISAEMLDIYKKLMVKNKMGNCIKYDFAASSIKKTLNEAESENSFEKMWLNQWFIKGAFVVVSIS